MIYLVHGENFAYSRNIVLNQQKKLSAQNRVEISINDTTPAQLQDLTTSFDMFGNPPFVVLDISGAGRMNVEEYIQALKKVPQETTLIILSSKTLSKSNPFIKEAGTLSIKVVFNEKKAEGNIFKFVDLLFNANRNGVYKELQNLILEDQDPFYIFSMILYGARKYHHKFKGESLKNLFKELYQIDIKIKTGAISPDMFIPYTVEKILYAQIQTI